MTITLKEVQNEKYTTHIQQNYVDINTKDIEEQKDCKFKSYYNNQKEKFNTKSSQNTWHKIYSGFLVR